MIVRPILSSFPGERGVVDTELDLDYTSLGLEDDHEPKGTLGHLLELSTMLLDHRLQDSTVVTNVFILLLILPPAVEILHGSLDLVGQVVDDFLKGKGHFVAS